MRTKISKLLLAVGCSASLMMTTSCIEETFPTSSATEDQLVTSSMATEAMLWAMPAFFNNHATIGSDRHWDWGYGSIMHVRDVMTQDLVVVSTGYDWYSSWAENSYLGENYIYGQFIWNYYWKFVQTSNNLIKVVDPETATDEQLGYLGAGHAFRALAYLDMAQMYEFLPNDAISGVNAAGNKVDSLTVPIVREGLTEEEARNNPRATRAEMAEFILEDLTKAAEYIVYLEESSKAVPHLDVVYGLFARYYMWLGDYANAKLYARMAIDNSSVQPMSETACLSTTNGFNTLDAWMWGAQTQSEDDVVKTGIVNWASWMCPEATFGYSAAGATSMIDASLYHKISDTDFRKKMFKAPAGSAMDGKTEYIWPAFADYYFPTYTSVKFRPGSGNIDDYTVGASTAYPIMRVEEMYFIEAEAAAHLNDAEGQALINNFMSNYRDPEYNTAVVGDSLINEIVLQKRIEFWGEGLTFYDVKRLNMSVTRGYPGTNFGEAKCFNTIGRPAWMNICIVQTEKNNNTALVGYENPDPTGCYEAWSE